VHSIPIRLLGLLGRAANAPGAAYRQEAGGDKVETWSTRL
jgi:hypothetical protein